MKLSKVSCGKQNENNTAPWMAILVSENPDTNVNFLACTGALISDRDILFPARCLENMYV